MLETGSATQTITVQDTTAPEFTFVPADYTVECSDEMPMDDATASDNCGEVTIEVSSETTAGDAAGNYVMPATAAQPRSHRPHRVHSHRRCLEASDSSSRATAACRGTITATDDVENSSSDAPRPGHHVS